MNPGLAVKLRPTGPWRIGPDSGARNQVDSIYHSDSLYAAVTSALARLGLLDEWLEATARNGSPAVCFSSCFPFCGRDRLRDSAAHHLAARSRPVWRRTCAGRAPVSCRSALCRRFSAGQSLDENQWAVDGVSGCLLPRRTPRSLAHGRSHQRRPRPPDGRSRAPFHRLHRIPAGRRAVGRRLLCRRCRARPVGRARCRPPSACSPIPASAANAPAAGADRPSPNSPRARCRR